MIEKFGENLTPKVEEETKEEMEKGPDFDREAEKERRKEIRKMMIEVLSETLKKEGLSKKGYALWQKKIENALQLVYLQRSQFGHDYMIEAGICNEKDIPERREPHIADCKTRKRIEYIVEEIEKERLPQSENKEQEIKEKMNAIDAALDFESFSSLENHQVFSVDDEQVKEKIETIKKAVGEYIPLWLEKHSKAE